METTDPSIAPLLGRVLLSWIFLYSSTQQILHFTQNVTHVTATGLPLPKVAIACSIVFQMLGGLALLAGFKTRIAAWALFLFLIPTTLVLHRFWLSTAAPTQQIQFYKNMAIMGGLLFVAAFGPGRLSVERKFVYVPISKLVKNNPSNFYFQQ